MPGIGPGQVETDDAVFLREGKKEPGRADERPFAAQMQGGSSEFRRPFESLPGWVIEFMGQTDDHGPARYLHLP